jgi:outer membrane immunogenic protein
MFAPPAARAADMPLKAPPRPAPVCAWCGFYIGGDIGGFDASQSAATSAFPSPGFGAPAVLGGGLAGFGQTPTAHSLKSTGLIGGFYAGYNWQFNNSVVGGVEGDISFLNRHASDTQISSATFPAVPAPDFNMTVSASNRWLGSARARLGFTTGQALFYVTGGGAWTRTDYAASAVGFNSPPSINALAGTTAATAWSDSRTGFAVGGGVEAMLFGAANWLVRVEYLYYQFAGSSAVMSTLGNGVDVCAPGLCNWSVTTSTLRINTVRAGLSHKFGP